MEIKHQRVEVITKTAMGSIPRTHHYFSYYRTTETMFEAYEVDPEDETKYIKVFEVPIADTLSILEY